VRAWVRDTDIMEGRKARHSIWSTVPIFSHLLTGGLLLYRPFGPGVQVEEIAVKAATELERAEGPAGNSHAREGVARDMNKIEGRRPGTRNAGVCQDPSEKT